MVNVNVDPDTVDPDTVDPDTVDPDTVAVLLAAGGGTRFSGHHHKLLAPLQGRPVVAHALDAVVRAGFAHVIVVTGAVDIPVDHATGPHPSLHVVHHRGWADGQATSLQVGIDAARRLGAAAVVVGLGDQPAVTSSAWRRVARATTPIAVASYEGHRAPPVRLAAEVWPLLPTRGDEGARLLMRLRPELVSEIPCTGNPGDIDTLEDLARWTSTMNSPSNDRSTKPGQS